MTLSLVAYTDKESLLNNGEYIANRLIDTL